VIIGHPRFRWYYKHSPQLADHVWLWYQNQQIRHQGKWSTGGTNVCSLQQACSLLPVHIKRKVPVITIIGLWISKKRAKFTCRHVQQSEVPPSEEIHESNVIHNLTHILKLDFQNSFRQKTISEFEYLQTTQLCVRAHAHL
jgi:hypothetical protein